jgi:hypothetical protein
MSAHDVEDDTPSLPDLAEMLRHATEDLALIDEHLTSHRHGTPDHGDRLELHSIDDAVNRAWAFARLALTGLTEFTAVKL